MNLGCKKQTSLLMQTPNKMIKGILGSFTPIGQDQRVGERAFRVQWRDSLHRKITGCLHTDWPSSKIRS